MSVSTTATKFFKAFIRGCEKRMGRLVNQDLGISIEVLLLILGEMEMVLGQKEVTKEERRSLVMAGAAFVILFGAALRGGEVLLLQASELCLRIGAGQSHAGKEKVLIPLMGRFKGETGETNVLLPLVSNTDGGGLQIRRWVEALVTILIAEGKHELRIG